jgi:hypothetical protein
VTEERCGYWKTVKGWFSWNEIKEAGSESEYLSGIDCEIVNGHTRMDDATWILRGYGRNPSCGAG